MPSSSGSPRIHPFLLYLSLFPLTLASLQPRPVSTFPIDPYATPKYDIAFLNHLPISRSEVDWWNGELSDAKENLKRKGRARQREKGRRGLRGKKGKNETEEMVRWNRLITVQRKALEDENINDLRSDPTSSEINPISPPILQSSSSRNPLEISFLSGDPPLTHLTNLAHSPSSASNQETSYGIDLSSDADQVALARVPEGIEYAEEVLVYWLTRHQHQLQIAPPATDSLTTATSSDIKDSPTSSESHPSHPNPSFFIPKFQILSLTPAPFSIPHPSAPHRSAIKLDYLCMIPSEWSMEKERQEMKLNRTRALRGISESEERNVGVSTAGSEEEQLPYAEEGHVERNIEGEGVSQTEEKVQAASGGGKEKDLDPWNSLKHLEGKCLYHRQGWFTYAYCHGSHVRQFRSMAMQQQVADGGFIPLEDQQFEAYNLGLSTIVYNHRLDLAQDKADETGEEQIINDMDPPPTLSATDLIVTTEVVEAEEDALALAYAPAGRSPAEQRKDLALQKKGRNRKSRGLPGQPKNPMKDRHLSLTWGGGTVCDITGRDRKIEVQFHCRMDGVDEIAFVKEVATCQYILIIHTPRLCTLPGFHTPSPADHPSHAIKCRQIIPDDQIQYSLSRRESSLVSPLEKEYMDDKVVEGEDQAVADAAREKSSTDLAEKIRQIKETGSRKPEGIPGPKHLYEWTDGGLPKQTVQAGEGSTGKIPVTLQFETEDGEVHEVVVEFSAEQLEQQKKAEGGDGDDIGEGNKNINEWGDEIAKLPKAKRRKIKTDSTTEAKEDEEAKKAYILSRRAEIKARRERKEAEEREERAAATKARENGFGANMVKWWKGLKKKVAAGFENEDSEEEQARTVDEL